MGPNLIRAHCRMLPAVRAVAVAGVKEVLGGGAQVQGSGFRQGPFPLRAEAGEVAGGRRIPGVLFRVRPGVFVKTLLQSTDTASSGRGSTELTERTLTATPASKSSVAGRS